MTRGIGRQLSFAQEEDLFAVRGRSNIDSRIGSGIFGIGSWRGDVHRARAVQTHVELRGIDQHVSRASPTARSLPVWVGRGEEALRAIARHRTVAAAHRTAFAEGRATG